MPSLHDIQVAMRDAIVLGRSDRLNDWVLENGIPARQRIQVYTNNCQVGFAKTMEASYPAIQRLAGEAWFLQSVRQYQQQCPSRCGDMQYLGERYPQYLQGELRGTEHEYFVDVARLEWAYQEALCAANSEALDIAGLGRVEPSDYDDLQFTLRSSVRLVASRFPLFAIWQANHGGEIAESTPISLSQGDSHVLIVRRSGIVEVREAPAEVFELAVQFERRARFGDAAQACLARYPHTDIGASLRWLIGVESLGEFTMGAASRGAVNQEERH